MKKILIAIIYKNYHVICSVLGRYRLGRFYPIRLAHRFFLFVLKSLKLNFAEVQGHKMFLDSKDLFCLSISGVWEPLETELVKKEIRKGDTVLDIGANIGYYTLIFAKLVGKNGKVFAFEPDPTNFALLKKNVEINGYENVVLVQKAVSNKNGKLRLFLGEGNTGDHRIYDSHDARKFVEIESVKLDDYFKDYNGKINFIKMDIQGAGGAVQGMIKLLKKNKCMKIISEFWPIGLKRFGIGPLEYLKLLLKHGFKLYEINGQKKKIEPTTPKELLDMYTPEKEDSINLLWIRNMGTR